MRFFKIITLIIFTVILFFPVKRVEVVLDIPPGTSALHISRMLAEKNIVASSRLFLLFLEVTGNSKKLRAGSYSLKTGMNYFTLLNRLLEGSDLFIQVTIPEGFTTEQIARRLEENGAIKDRKLFIEKVLDQNLRGYLFPETYNLSPDLDADAIIRIMKSQFEKEFPEKYRERAAELGFTVQGIVTLASLIEKEAKLPGERPIISDIFHKRLKKRIYLESCASVLFALGKHKKRLTYKDLEVDSPYNTYRHFGLPPTPICNPGRDSIHAALYPADTDYLYFFTTGNGSHVFSSTYKEHLRRQKTALN